MTADPNAYYTSRVGVGMYDLFTGQGLLAGDLDFYLDCAREYGGPILELGVGTGRLLVPLAEAGYDVVGLDLSRPMLDIAAARLAGRGFDDRTQLVEASMADFDLDRQFPLVIIAARSFQHLTNPAAQRATLECVRRHLSPSGTLVLDLFDPNFELLAATHSHGPKPREARNPETGELVRRTVVSRHHDGAAQTIEETLRFEVVKPDGAVETSEQTSWTLRWSTRQETTWLLELCGLEPIALYSDFNRSPPAYGCEQLWVARAV